MENMPHGVRRNTQVEPDGNVKQEEGRVDPRPDCEGEHAAL